MAQIISLDKLKKLAAHPVAEAEHASRFYWQFSDMFQDRVEELSRGQKGMRLDDALMQAYREMKEKFLRKNCPPIRFVGLGSSRASYALDGGQCLKIATCRAGIGQNEAEAKNMEQSGSLGIFPKLYDFADDYSSILVECVSPCRSNQQLLSGLQLGSAKSADAAQDIAGFLELAIEQLPGDFDDVLEDILDNAHNSMFKALAAAALAPKCVAHHVFSGIVEYALSNSSDFDVVDLGSLSNWGFAVRNGKVVPIVLDAGFSPEVRDSWY